MTLMLMNPRTPAGATPRRLHTCALFLALALCSAVAAAATSQQRKIVEDYLEAAGDGETQSVILNFFHGGDVEKFRTRIIEALDAEKAEGRGAIRTRLFGNAASLDELRRLTPPNLLMAMTRRIPLPAGRTKEVEMIEVVEENGDTQHAVVRAWPEKKRQGPGRVRLVTLRKLLDRSWRIGIPEDWLAQVDAALAGEGAGAGSAAGPGAGAAAGTDAATSAAGTPDQPAAANSPEIVQLLDSSARMLREGNCTSYYTIYVSPKFRAAKSEKALKTLIQQCERSIDMREMYVSALDLARQGSPTMQADGMRAVYDLKNQGLPFQNFTLERVGDRWFIAE